MKTLHLFLRLMLIICFLYLSHDGPASALAGTIMIPIPIASANAGVPVTGQTSSLPYFAVPGSDGNLRAGVTWPSPRFVDNNDGTVTDKLTNLVWLKKANCINNTKYWQEALDFVSATIFDSQSPDPYDDCGLKDKSKKGAYRLPNVNELRSLVAWQYSFPSITDADGRAQCDAGNCVFQGVVYLPEGAPYWTSSTSAKNPNDAWVISFSAGGDEKLDKTTRKCYTIGRIVL